jgi:hypothetical protein
MCTNYINVHIIYKFMDERAKNLLRNLNPWWEEKEIEVPVFERKLLGTIRKDLKLKQILAISGLRRVGKTVIMMQVIKGLAGPADNICYISFDDISFQDYEKAMELVDYFLAGSDRGKTRFLFLDEIQKVPHWADLLKVIYDTYDKLKTVISGSASLEVRGEKETLAGRMFTYNLPPLCFREFVRFHGMDPGEPEKPIMRWYDRELLGNKQRYEELFDRWLIGGAFPEMLGVDDFGHIKRYLNEAVIDKAIIDTARLAGENPVLIHELFRVLAGSNAQLFENVNLASILGINRNKVAHCIDLLEKTLLISTSRNYSASIAKQARTSKKVYLAHSSLVLAILDWPAEVLMTDAVGHIVEAAVANGVHARFFWKGVQNGEVDIILDTKPPIPIEVKYQANVTTADAKSLIKFCERNKIKHGMIITKQAFDPMKINGIDVLFVPAWVFLLYGPSIQSGI